MSKHRFIALLVAALLPQTASAHLVSTRFGELYSGLVHPVTALEHLVPWLGLGLLGGLLRAETSRLALGAFPLAVGFAALLAGYLPQSSMISGFNVATFVLLGLLVALATRLNAKLFVGLTVLVGLTHGYANGTTELAGGALLLYVLGVMLAGYLIVALTTGFTHFIARRAAWGTIAVRAVGSWIVAVGLVFGAYSVTPFV